MKIIGFTGLKRSGKDTCAELARVHIITVAQMPADLDSFAAPIRHFFGTWFPPPTDKEAPYPGLKFSPRRGMQTLGTEWGRAMDHDMWVSLLDYRLKHRADHRKGTADEDFITLVPDVRFDNEAKWIIDNGGAVVMVTRPNLIRTEDLHISERGISARYVTHAICNDAGIKDLEEKVANLLQPILKGYSK